jgi:predicted neuraminidase
MCKIVKVNDINCSWGCQDIELIHEDDTKTTLYFNNGLDNKIILETNADDWSGALLQAATLINEAFTVDCETGSDIAANITNILEGKK